MQKVIYQIYPQFKHWLLDKIKDAGWYMVNRTIVDLTPDQIFEALVPQKHWFILQQASALLKPVRYQTFTVDISVVTLTVDINYLNPQPGMIFPTKLNPIEGKLLEYLTPSLQIACEWATLQHVTKELIDLTNDRNMLANLFPWLPDVIRESGWILIPNEVALGVDWNRVSKRIDWYKNEVGLTNKLERYACDRTFIAALKRRTSALALTNDVRDAVALGSKLFTQYRLAKQDESSIKAKRSTITPLITNSLVHSNILKGLDEVKQLYKHDRWV